MNINKENNFVSVIVYLHNDEKNVLKFLTSIYDYLSTSFNSYEIICVNDKSNDNTVKIINDFCIEEKIESVSVITTSFYQGRENAMVAGLDLAIGDFVYEFETSLVDYTRQDLLDAYNLSLQGNDIVFAYSNDSVKLLPRLFYRVFNNFSLMKYKIRTLSFSVISRRGINRVKSMEVKTVYRKAIYASCGLKVADIKYNNLNSTNKSKNNNKLNRDLAMNSLILFTNIGYKVSMVLIFLMLVAILFIVAYTGILYFMGAVIEGWTTTMLLISFGFFGLFVILSFVIKYLELILNLVFTKKQYTIENIDRINCNNPDNKQ